MLTDATVNATKRTAIIMISQNALDIHLHAEQSDELKSRSRATLKWKINPRDSVIAVVRLLISSLKELR